MSRHEGRRDQRRAERRAIYVSLESHGLVTVTRGVVAGTWSQIEVAGTPGDNTILLVALQSGLVLNESLEAMIVLDMSTWFGGLIPVGNIPPSGQLTVPFKAQPLPPSKDGVRLFTQLATIRSAAATLDASASYVQVGPGL